jgi:hypothetical protein
MQLEGTLEEWLKNPPVKLLKTGGDTFPFSSKYETFKHHLNTNLHKEVTKQAIYHEFISGKDKNTIIWLNDHGPDHINTVINRASDLLNNGDKCDLNPREVFLLLNSIQVHDIGNFYGRYNHEAKVLEAIGQGLTPILFDVVETKYVRDIAQVHGGKVKYKNGSDDKNTISTIKAEVTSDGYRIRQQLLASILRFADELADDKYRADLRSLNEDKIPSGSEVFHAYAGCLDTVKILHSKNTVELHFKVPKAYLLRTFGKIQPDQTVKQVYLLNEIYERAIKMHTERIYCSKFWKSQIDIDNIWVQIEFYGTADDGTLNEDSLFVHNDITFTLHDNQYPISTNDIFKLCPELVYSEGVYITGENMSKKIEGQL